jgi:hypothetical protein
MPRPDIEMIREEFDLDYRKEHAYALIDYIEELEKILEAAHISWGEVGDGTMEVSMRWEDPDA